MWDERYAESGFAYGTEPNDFLAEVASQIPSGRVLCLAEGEGRNAAFLAQRGYEVCAVDQSAVGLRKAQELAIERGASIEIRVADLADFEPPAAHFQGIVSIWAHLPAPIRRRLHRLCVEALAPGGLMILEAYTPAQVGRGTGGPPVAALMMSAVELREELAGLEFLRIEERLRPVSEGKYHQGESAVLQIVARKPEAGR